MNESIPPKAIEKEASGEGRGLNYLGELISQINNEAQKNIHETNSKHSNEQLFMNFSLADIGPHGEENIKTALNQNLNLLLSQTKEA